MRLVNMTPLVRSSVGFDRLFDLIENVSQKESEGVSPPYDIEKTGADAYRITLAAAGFGPDELSITSRANELTVTGKKAAKASGEFFYQGIPMGAFQRRFGLADHVRVTGANLNGGLLSIDLVREVPESAKPRRIAITHAGERKLERRAA